MLVCEFFGLEVMRRAYADAIAGGYRFYSYGDACLLFRARNRLDLVRRLAAGMACVSKA